MTDRVVVGDFRQAAVALGHEGAPITTAAMRRMYATPGESRLIVNIGGMANYFYFPSPLSKVPSSSADCGPGNSLCDLLAKELTGNPLDRNGAAAARGTVSQRLLSLLLAHPFFKRTTDSTGREQFGSAEVKRMLDFGQQQHLPVEDLLATAAELTTMSIALKIWPIVRRDHRLSALYLSGGGRRNRHFVRRLSHHLPDLELRSIDELGIDGDLVEAAAYAVMGEACLSGEALETLPGRSTNRIRKDPLQPVLGHISQPPVRTK